MYNQSISPDFYNQVKKSDTVIYVFIDDHYRRMTGETFQLFDDYSYLHYKVRGNELIQDNYSSYMLNLLRSSYTLRLLRSKIKNAYIDNPKNAAKITDDALLYLVKTRENLQNHWNNKIKFYVVLYGRVKYSDILRKKLKDNGFIIIDSSSITKADLFSAKYLMKDNGHPKESAWDILTPGIAEKIESSGETK